MKTKMLSRKGIVRTFLAIVTALLLVQATAQPKIKETAAREKIFVCHYGKMIIIDRSSWPAHQAHGDKIGPCENEPPVDPGPDPEAFRGSSK